MVLAVTVTVMGYYQDINVLLELRLLLQCEQVYEVTSLLPLMKHETTTIPMTTMAAVVAVP